jgi:hypothetical protein
MVQKEWYFSYIIKGSELCNKEILKCVRFSRKNYIYVQRYFKYKDIYYIVRGEKLISNQKVQ